MTEKDNKQCCNCCDNSKVAELLRHIANFFEKEK